MYVDHAKMEVIIQGLYTVFEKVAPDTTCHNPHTANVFRLRPCKEHLLRTYSMHRVKKLEEKMDTLRSTLCVFCQQMLCRISEREGVNTTVTFESTSAVMRTLLRECSVLFQRDSTAWTYSQVIISLCSESMRAELKKVENMPVEKTVGLCLSNITRHSHDVITGAVKMADPRAM